jgi:hypothetical protein
MIHFQVTRNDDLYHTIKIHEDSDIEQMFDVFYSQLLALGFTFGTIQQKIINDAAHIKSDINIDNED